MTHPQDAPQTIGLSPTALRALWLVILALFVWLTVLLLRLGLTKNYAIDEFTYAHASWLIAKGELPYRDFFCHHVPLSYFYYALPFLFLDDNPTNIIWLRVAALPFVVLLGVCLWTIGARHGRLTAAFALLFAFSMLPFAAFASEMRPDPMALALFLSALAVLTAGWRPSVRGMLAGILVAVAVLVSEKVVFYGGVLGVAFVVDLAYNRRRHGRALLGDPLLFLAAALLVGALAALYLTVTHSWRPWFRWSVGWTAEYMQEHGGFTWQRYFWRSVAGAWLVGPFAFIGLMESIRALVRKKGEAWLDMDWILIGIIPLAFLSYALQKAAYGYSLLPVLAVAAVFAARGFVVFVRYLANAAGSRQRGNRLALGFAVLVLAVLIVSSGTSVQKRLRRTNAYQHAILSELGELTSPDDPVYDNSGGFVTRPHVLFFYFTNSFMRTTLQEELATSVPLAIQATGCTVYLQDVRGASLPQRLQNYILDHYMPYNGDIWLWGQRFAAKPGYVLLSEFLAVRDAEYFVTPLETIEDGTLRIDGQPIATQVFRLAKGRRKIEYDGPVERFFILWRPRNDVLYTPDPDPVRRFSSTF